MNDHRTRAPGYFAFGLVVLWAFGAVALFFLTQPYVAAAGSPAEYLYVSRLATVVRDAVTPWLSAAYKQ